MTDSDIPRPQAGRHRRHSASRTVAAVLASGVMTAALLTGNTAAAATPDPATDGVSEDDTRATEELSQAGELDTADDGLRIDAASYAEDYDVAIDEAISRLTAQDEYARLVERIAETHRDTFAGSDIDHGEDFGLQLYFTDDVAAEAVEQTVASTALSRPSVRIDDSAKIDATASIRLVEEVEIPEELDGLVDGLSYDVATHTVTADVVSAPVQAQQTEQQLTTAVAEAAETADATTPQIAVERHDTPAADGHSGGLHLSTCTSGFAVSVGGTQGITTAGHCGNNQEYSNYCCDDWWPLTFQSEARTATADVQWHTTRIGARPRFVASSESSYRTVSGRVLRGNQQGSYVCHRGKTTGYSCGTVQDNTYRLTYSNACPDTCAATWVRTAGSSLRCYPGDSGGVVFSAYDAYGLYKGQASSGTGAADCSYMFHMPIDYLTGINADLLTG